jgi:hypothetical protein
MVTAVLAWLIVGTASLFGGGTLAGAIVGLGKTVREQGETD